jgi:hypothetical protein
VGLAKGSTARTDSGCDGYVESLYIFEPTLSVIDESFDPAPAVYGVSSDCEFVSDIFRLKGRNTQR